MPRLGSFFGQSSLTGWSRYFDYQVAVAREAVIPWLRDRMPLEGVRIGDFGCHEGGMLHAFREDTGVAGGLGLELNSALVERSPFVADGSFRLEVGDLATARGEETFGLVLLHDVLEHVGDVEAVVRASAARLAPGGRLFVSFPPYRSPFGGHQQYAAGAARALPYVHHLPKRLFLRVARPAATEYMTAADALEDLRSVRRTRLTLARAEAAFAGAGLRAEHCELFLVRPEHSLRYGVPTVGAGPLGAIPVLRELIVSGAYYLLAPSCS